MVTDNSARIAQIENILQSGVSSGSVNGESVTYNLDSLRKELSRLKAADTTMRRKRPYAARINLDNFP